MCLINSDMLWESIHAVWYSIPKLMLSMVLNRDKQWIVFLQFIITQTLYFRKRREYHKILIINSFVSKINEYDLLDIWFLQFDFAELFLCERTRCDQKITVILSFFQKYLFIPYNTFFSNARNTSEMRLFGIVNSSCFDFSFISSIVAKRLPFIDVFSFGKRKMSTGAKSGEYGGWGMIMVLFLAKNSRTSIDVWAGALTYRKIYDWFFHNSMRF